MPDPITATVVGGGLIGGSILGSNAQSDAIDSAAQAQKEGTAYAADIQKQMYDKQLELQQPFLQSGYTGNSMLAALVTGTPTSYTDPNYTKYNDARGLAQKNWEAVQANPGLVGQDFWKDIGNGEDPINRLMRYQDSYRLPYDAKKTWYQGPDGQLTQDPPKTKFDPNSEAAAQFKLPSTSEIPTLSGLPGLFSAPDLPDYASMVPKSDLPDYDAMVTNAKFEESPAYKALMEQGTRGLNRLLASRNLQGGGQAVTSLRDMATDITAKEYGNQFSRNQSRYSAALNDALTKYQQNQNAYAAATDKTNTLYNANKDIYNAGTDKALNLYNAGMKTYGLKTDAANTQYGRLTDMLKLGQGAASAMGGAAQNYGTSAANIAMTGANNMANAQLAKGQVKSNLYTGLGQMPAQAVGMAMSGGLIGG